MPGFSELQQQGTMHAWLFAPSAIPLGAPRGREPGHSKATMAAFIVAIRGSVGQAVMLGLATAVSHMAVVWLVALGGMHVRRTGRCGRGAEHPPYIQAPGAVLRQRLDRRDRHLRGNPCVDADRSLA